MKKFLLFALSIITVITCGIFLFAGHTDAGILIATGMPILANMSRGELEEFAENALSDNYEDYEEYSGYDDLDDEDLYDGYEDDYLQFLGAARSFLDEKKNGVYLIFKIVNNTGYSKVVALNPAYFNTLAFRTTVKLAELNAGVYEFTRCSVAEMVASGHKIDAVIMDGVSLYNDYADLTKNITCTATNGKINDHLAFIRNNPTRVPQITLSSIKTSTGAVDTTAYNKVMTIQKVSAYRSFGPTLVDLNEFFRVEQYQSGKIDIDTAKFNLQMDDQTLVFIEVDNDITLTVKMHIGGIGNGAAQLFNKAQTAERNIQKQTAGVIPPAVLKHKKQLARKQSNMLRRMAFGRKRK